MWNRIKRQIAARVWWYSQVWLPQMKDRIKHKWFGWM